MYAQTLLNIAIEVVHITQQHADQNSVNPAPGLTEITCISHQPSAFRHHTSYLQ